MPRFQNNLLLLTLLCAALLAAGCGPRSLPPRSAATPPVPVAASASSDARNAGPRFHEEAATAGLRYAWTAAGKRPLNILQTIGNGCALLDYDNDGKLDALLVGARPALFRGDGAGHFTNVSAASGIGALRGHFLGCAVGDYDNDGWDDVYLSGYREGRLLQNRSGRFEDVTRAVGLGPQPWGTSCGWADLDNDGWLDLYVANYVDFGPHTDPQLCRMPTPSHGTVASACGPRFYQPIRGVLLQNQKGKTFRDVTQAWGADAHTGKGLGVAFADYDGSGRVGLAVANDEVAGDLFENAGAGTLRNVGVESGTAYDRDGGVHGGMGVDWGDYNNDGRLDLFVATFQHEAKNLYRNDGAGLFTDVSPSVGIGEAARPFVGFGAKFADFDNNGWLDLLLASGHVQDNIAQIENATYRQKLLLLSNQDGTFTDATKRAGLTELPAIVGRGLAIGDVDNDGRMDALVVDSEGAPLLLRNQTPAGTNRWVGFRIAQPGAGTNRDGYGTVVTIMSGGKTWVRQCQPGGSYLSSSDPRLHFGLGSTAQTLDRITVRWPDGKTETWTGVPTGRYLTLRRGAAPE